MIKIYHEAPKCLFKKMQEVTDGDYALAHLFEEDSEYYKLFNPEERDVILDNSVFELGQSINLDRFAYWVRKLKPTWYIVPDVFNNGIGTSEAFFSFINAYPDLPGKRIGVAQGGTYEELVNCYQAIEPFCDKVAISFGYSLYKEECPCGSVCHSFMLGRISILERLVNDGVINKNKPHHLLGTALPQEIAYYAKNPSGMFRFIDSIDTSNPVVHGIFKVRYTPEGLSTKEETKLCELINYVPTAEEEEVIWYNVYKYREFATPLTEEKGL